MKNPFTIEQGIEVQTNQLRRWKSILKSDKFLLLYEFATSSNVDAKTGYDIMRGVTLDNWIHNNLMSDVESIELENSLKVKRALGTITITEDSINRILDDKYVVDSILLMLITQKKVFENEWEYEFKIDEAKEYLKEYFETTPYDKDFIAKSLNETTIFN